MKNIEEASFAWLSQRARGPGRRTAAELGGHSGRRGVVRGRRAARGGVAQGRGDDLAALLAAEAAEPRGVLEAEAAARAVGESLDHGGLHAARQPALAVADATFQAILEIVIPEHPEEPTRGWPAVAVTARLIFRTM